MSSVTHEEYIELVESILETLRPDQPVSVHIVNVVDPKSGAKSARLGIRLDVLRGPRTEILFHFRDVLGLSELHLQAFIISKLAAIGVHPSEVRAKKVEQFSSAPPADEVPTDAEAAKLRELLTKRRMAREAGTPVPTSLEVADTPIEEEDGGFFGPTPNPEKKKGRKTLSNGLKPLPQTD